MSLIGRARPLIRWMHIANGVLMLLVILLVALTTVPNLGDWAGNFGELVGIPLLSTLFYYLAWRALGPESTMGMVRTARIANIVAAGWFVLIIASTFTDKATPLDGQLGNLLVTLIFGVPFVLNINALRERKTELDQAQADQAAELETERRKDLIREAVLALHRSLDEMEANLAYISRELPELEMPGRVRAAITGMCDHFNSALYDVRKEVRTLEDKLGLHPGEEPYDPGVTNPDPKVTLALIEKWLVPELKDFHAIVELLRREKERDSEMGIVVVLVEESGANILNAFSAIKDSLSFIAAQLDAESIMDKPTREEQGQKSGVGVPLWQEDRRPEMPKGPLPEPEDRPGPNGLTIAQHSFACSLCGREAGLVRLSGSPIDAKIIRQSFTSTLTGRVPADAFDRVRRAIETGDIRDLYDYDLEVASFYCPRCGSSYCGNHWVRWDVFDDDDGFIWHDSIRGRCPRSHERMLED